MFKLLRDQVSLVEMGSLRMLIVFICLIPFWKFRIPERKYWLPLFCFFAFFRVLEVWMSIPNCPIRRCGHFHRTILSGDEFLGHFGRFSVFCKNLKNENHENLILLED